MVTIRKDNVWRLVSEQELICWQERGFVPCDRIAGERGESGMPLSLMSDTSQFVSRLPTAKQLRRLLIDHNIPFRKSDPKSVLVRQAVEAGLLLY